jgi:organic hydroperoxide reductase OsmC/OhrA
MYEAKIQWQGSTGQGWENYDRGHTAKAPPAEPSITLTTGEPHGDSSQLNPEQLVVMAASSCQLLFFLHLASKARIDVVEYEDDADAEMPENRLTRITLRPRIVVASETTEERVRKLVELAHEHCYIANSLNSEVLIEPRVELRQGA